MTTSRKRPSRRGSAPGERPDPRHVEPPEARQAIEDEGNGLLRAAPAEPDATEGPDMEPDDPIPFGPSDEPEAEEPGGCAVDSSAGGSDRASHAQRLLGLTSAAELFHTPDGRAWADIRPKAHRETWSLGSAVFRDWLSRVYYLAEGRPPPAAAVNDVLNVLRGRARYDGPERSVFVRAAEMNGAIYLDLANASWEAVEVKATGWHIVTEPPVRFRRSHGMMALPTPQKGGDIATLRSFVNVANEDDWRLMLAWIVAALRPTGPYPVLVLHGEQGSAKSTTAKVLRSLVDPNTAQLRSKPRDERDLFITASNSWVVAMDNLSGISAELSDALCRLATGGGFATRELYSDEGETLFECTRPTMLTGIDALTVRGDLADRAVVLTLPSIGEGARRPERVFWQSFEAAAPRMLGALLDALTGALRHLGNVQLSAMPRMADFAQLGAAMERALGWPDGAFQRAYAGNRAYSAADAVDSSPIARALVRLAAANPSGWSGTASELLVKLSGTVPPAERGQRWPRGANILSGQIQRAAPVLRHLGVEVDTHREGRDRTRTITVRMVATNDRPHRPQ